MKEKLKLNTKQLLNKKQPQVNRKNISPCLFKRNILFIFELALVYWILPREAN